MSELTLDVSDGKVAVEETMLEVVYVLSKNLR